MRILVMSDTHGDRYSPSLAIEQQPDAKYIIHLGDGASDIDDLVAFYSDRKFIRVKGNCDFSSDLPAYRIESIGGKRIYITHGYMERVKFGPEVLYYTAREKEAQIALFGHTHEPYIDYYDGIHIFNPGSLRDGKYGVIDITPKGIMCFGVEVRR